MHHSVLRAVGQSQKLHRLTTVAPSNNKKRGNGAREKSYGPSHVLCVCVRMPGKGHCAAVGVPAWLPVLAAASLAAAHASVQATRAATWSQLGKTQSRENVQGISIDYGPDGFPVFAYGWDDPGVQNGEHALHHPHYTATTPPPPPPLSHWGHGSYTVAPGHTPQPL